MRGSLHGAGAAEGGEAVLGFAECKMTRNGPRGWSLGLCLYGAMIRTTPEICVARVRLVGSALDSAAPLLYVASNVLHQT